MTLLADAADRRVLAARPTPWRRIARASSDAASRPRSQSIARHRAHRGRRSARRPPALSSRAAHRRVRRSRQAPWRAGREAGTTPALERGVGRADSANASSGAARRVAAIGVIGLTVAPTLPRIGALPLPCASATRTARGGTSRCTSASNSGRSATGPNPSRECFRVFSRRLVENR